MFYQPEHVQTLSEFTDEVKIFLPLMEMGLLFSGLIPIPQHIPLSSRWAFFPESFPKKGEHERPPQNLWCFSCVELLK